MRKVYRLKNTKQNIQVVVFKTRFSSYEIVAYVNDQKEHLQTVNVNNSKWTEACNKAVAVAKVHYDNLV